MKAKPFTTQITGGVHKGKKLLLPAKDTTRSSKSILKGSLFDTLQYDLHGNYFVELFGGSGAIGLEALSRGAKEVWFIEKDQKAYDTLLQNCRAIDATSTHPIRGDTFERYDEVIEAIRQRKGGAYLYFDPPFDIRAGMEEIYERVLELISRTPPSIVRMIILEHRTKIVLPPTIGPFRLKKSRKFGKSSLSYYDVA